MAKDSLAHSCASSEEFEEFIAFEKIDELEYKINQIKTLLGIFQNNLLHLLESPPPKNHDEIEGLYYFSIAIFEIASKD